jgi:hypothetical protein
MKKNFNGINKTGKDKLKELDDKRVSIELLLVKENSFQNWLKMNVYIVCKIAHIGELKPSLGHPNNLEILSELDSKEKERQGISSTTIEEFTISLKVGSFPDRSISIHFVLDALGAALWLILKIIFLVGLRMPSKTTQKCSRHLSSNIKKCCSLNSTIF